MAGKRGRPGGKPMQRHVKAQRRMLQLATELGAATGPGQRIGVAVDYLKAALAGTGGSPHTVEALVRELVVAGDQVSKLYRHAALNSRLAAAETPGDRLSIARDYLRQAAAPRGGHPKASAAESAAADQATTRITEGLVSRLIDQADQLLPARPARRSEAQR